MTFAAGAKTQGVCINRPEQTGALPIKKALKHWRYVRLTVAEWFWQGEPLPTARTCHDK